MNKILQAIGQALANLARLAAFLAIVAVIIFALAQLPIRASFNAVFRPALTRVDRSIIAACTSTLNNTQLSLTEKGTLLATMRCDRFSARELAQVDRDAATCIKEKAALGDAIVDPCIDAARGLIP